jgi:hypothetical protein
MTDGASPSRSRRIIFIVLGSLAGLLVIAAIAGYWAFRRFAPDLRAIGVAVHGEATEFAKGHTARECITEALARGAREADFMGGVKARLFLKFCLGKTARPADFCDGVPREGEIMATAQWLSSACAHYGKPGDDTCSRTLQSIVEVCSGK